MRKFPIINESCILGVICFCYDDITIIEVRHIITNKCKKLIEKRKRHMMGPKKHSKKERKFVSFVVNAWIKVTLKRDMSKFKIDISRFYCLKKGYV